MKILFIPVYISLRLHEDLPEKHIKKLLVCLYFRYLKQKVFYYLILNQGSPPSRFTPPPYFFKKMNKNRGNVFFPNFCLI